MVHPRIGQGVLGPSTDPQELVPTATQRFSRWSRGRRAHNLMNSNRLGRYTHIRSVCEKCAVGVNLVQKQIMAGTPVRQKELVITMLETNLGHQ